jgi:hypothetical protein
MDSPAPNYNPDPVDRPAPEYNPATMDATDPVDSPAKEDNPGPAYNLALVRPQFSHRSLEPPLPPKNVLA